MRKIVLASREIGSRLDLIQSGGGNTSVKIGNFIFIKRSGLNLSDIFDHTSFVPLSLTILKNELINLPNKKKCKKKLECIGNKILSKSNCSKRNTRPSIETFLHAFSKKYTIHTHPTSVSIYCSKNSLFNNLKNIYPDSYLVDYASPGIELFLQVYKTLRHNSIFYDNEIIFLKNHGLIVSSDSCSKAVKITNDISRLLSSKLGLDFLPYEEGSILNRALNTVFKDKILTKYIDDKNLSKDILKYCNERIHPFSPDISVFLGDKICLVNLNTIEQDLFSFYRKFRVLPSLVNIKNKLYVTSKSYQKLCEKIDVLKFYCQVMSFLYKDEDSCYLSDDETRYLRNWESEKFRR
ncbi:class II aldolase/adducin family protein [Candidatus Photodesmus blepharus]|uniref:class II aldolase/adducin family protein n=1 Tax=Candidatus Photodesmus blepharonis TaxID=1179155 RepID=UPI00054FE694|nr:class II aldolase/adducin family protein [Candidatus Photodesmus blepharus]